VTDIESEFVSEHGFRTPETVEGMRDAWGFIEHRWTATTERARRLPPNALYERVEEEWSFVETLRHLVFATDAWFRRTVLGETHAYWVGDLPHTEFDGDHSALGIDDTTPHTIDEVLAVRTNRWDEIRRVLDTLTADGLSRTCAQNPVAGYPEDTKVTVRGCLGVVLNEEWWHHRYATRDLAVLEGSFGAAG
jgi:hypothetical protein